MISKRARCRKCGWSTPLDDNAYAFQVDELHCTCGGRLEFLLVDRPQFTLVPGGPK